MIRAIGNGGQGNVWLAIRAADGRRAAVKVVRPAHKHNAHERARFEQSIATLAALDHPGIVTSIDSGELPTGELWHATDYVPGRTLLEHVEHLDRRFRHDRGSESRLPVAAIIELFVRICEAVEAAHRVGVIHRDLKPSNIVVDEQGQPRLLDFGHSTLPDTSGPSDLTLTGEFLGTPAYASPEQVLCRPGTIDVRSDVYAIAVMLYQCLTGTFPYEVSGSLAKTFEQIQYADPEPPRSHVPWIDRDLQAIMLCGLEKQRENRYQTAGELRADLERYRRGEAVRARGAGTTYLAIKFVRRHRVLAATTAVLAVLTIGYAVSMTVLYGRATRAEAREQVNARESRQWFAVMRRVFDSVVTRIDTQLERVAGMGELRTRLMGEIHDEMLVLTATQSRDPELRASKAEIHKKLADIAMRFGRNDEAGTHRNAALRLLQELVSEFPSNPDYRASLSIAHVLVGDMAGTFGRVAEQMEQYQLAMTMDESLVAEFPQQDRLVDQLSRSYERVAVCSPVLDHAQRRALHARRHELALRLVARDPQNPARMENLCVSHQFEARYARETDRARFIQHAAAAMQLAEQIVAAEPLNPPYVVTYSMAAFLSLEEPLRTGDTQTAIALMDRLAQRAEAIASREPDIRWGRICRDRGEAARKVIEQLNELDALPGEDLRRLIPRALELEGDSKHFSATTVQRTKS